MGIRINIKMGYGLVDLESGIDDPRIDSVSLASHQKNSNQFATGFLDHLRKVVKQVDKSHDSEFHGLEYALLIQQLESKQDLLSLWDVVLCDGESGLENVMLLIPPSCEETWSRYDDPIDYYLFGATGPFQMNDLPGSGWVYDTNRPLYPWVGYMDRHNGERVLSPTADLIRDFYVIKQAANPDLLKSLCEELGVSNEEELEQRFGAFVPLEIRELVKYLNLFNDEKTTYTLRPLIYCFWA